MDRRRPRRHPARPLVLIVDGDEDTRALYALALSTSGFDVVALPDRAQAHRRAWEIHPDAIVMDLPTPDCDGSELLRELHQDPRTRDIPVVGVSGYIDRSLLEPDTADGFAARFPKPCLPDTLASGLRRVLAGMVDARVTR